MDEILTAEQVANLLQVHVRTVYRLARKGGIPGKKLGGGWRFNKELILELLAREEQGMKSLENNPQTR